MKLRTLIGRKRENFFRESSWANSGIGGWLHFCGNPINMFGSRLQLFSKAFVRNRGPGLNSPNIVASKILSLKQAWNCVKGILLIVSCCPVWRKRLGAKRLGAKLFYAQLLQNILRSLNALIVEASSLQFLISEKSCTLFFWGVEEQLIVFFLL